MSETKIKGVGVDDDAKPLHDPVTVVVSPAGNRYDADTWSEAYNYVSAGYSFAEGYPTAPGEEPSKEAASKGDDTQSSSSADDTAPPAPSATKAAWVDYVVKHRQVSKETAEGLTRDQLAETYGSPAAS